MTRTPPVMTQSLPIEDGQEGRALAADAAGLSPSVEPASGLDGFATSIPNAGHTPGPWGWVVHDHSLASLGVLPDPGLGDPLVLAIGPCRSCARRVNDGEWKWGRCHTPSLADAALIAAAPLLLEALEAALDGLRRASRQLSEDHKLALNGRPWGGLLIDNAERAISSARGGQ